MSKASRATKWRSRSASWAGQISPPVQRRIASPSGRTASEPHCGQWSGKTKGTASAGRRASTTSTTCGITSPARWITTVSPTRMSLALDIVLVVQGRPGHHDAADGDRRQLGHRRQGTGAADLDRDRVRRRSRPAGPRTCARSPSAAPGRRSPAAAAGRSGRPCRPRRRYRRAARAVARRCVAGRRAAPRSSCSGRFRD